LSNPFPSTPLGFTPRYFNPAYASNCGNVLALCTSDIIDIVTISQWLGHASVTTTNRYATVDLEMKRKAIEQAQAIDHGTSVGLTLWRTDASILTWLEAL
jgi:integrase